MGILLRREPKKKELKGKYWEKNYTKNDIFNNQEFLTHYIYKFDRIKNKSWGSGKKGDFVSSSFSFVIYGKFYFLSPFIYFSKANLHKEEIVTEEESVRESGVKEEKFIIIEILE